MIQDAEFKWTYSPELFAYNALGAKIVALTYSWQRNAIERICFYVPAASPKELPTDEVYQKMASPVRPGATFIAGTTCGHRSNYFKLEFKFGIYQNVTKCLSLQYADGDRSGRSPAAARL
jgi:hypothetical protein